MDLNRRILSDIIMHTKYARWLPDEQRRETYEEGVNRNEQMHITRFPELEAEIRDAYIQVYAKRVLPSMRSMQFAGKPIELAPNRIFNCCFLHINDYRSFSEVMFLLLGGSGVGYSVQKHHVEQLPPVRKPVRKRRYLVGDSIEGWSDAVKMLMKAYLQGKSLPVFDFSDVRPKGARLITSGGKAPGPAPLKLCLFQIQQILDAKKDGEQLTTLECHDILCFIADAVLAGGIRRSAMIALFSIDDIEMLSCKAGKWFELNPQRGRANNSAVAVRSKLKEKDFRDFFWFVQNNNTGEPGIFLTNDAEWGLNPCKPLKSTILTPDGYITFGQALEKENLQIVGPDGKTYNASKPFKTGTNRQVAKVTLRNGTVIYGTPNHKHMVFGEGWKEIGDLQIDDKIEIHETYNVLNPSPAVLSDKEYFLGILAGWTHGDGSLSKRNDNRNGYTWQLCFGSQEFDVADWFGKMLDKPPKPHSQKPETCKVITSHKEADYNLLLDSGYNIDKTDLTWLYDKSESYKRGFLNAVFTADGSVRKKTSTVELYSTRRTALETLGNILREYGIKASVTKHANAKKYIAPDNKVRNNAICYKLVVASADWIQFGFLANKKQETFNAIEKKSRSRCLNWSRIKEIDLNHSIEDVYDITVDSEDHAFLDNGVTTHNCGEASLRDKQGCNLTELNASMIGSIEELLAASKAAAFIGTLQASYTDFHYLRPAWKRTFDRDALLGVGITGLASEKFLALDLEAAANVITAENARVADIIGIKQAARCCLVKPSGTTSLLLGTSSGIHDWHAKYYRRRIKLLKSEAIYKYLIGIIPELIEDDWEKPHLQAQLTVPMKAPEGAIVRADTSAIDLLERVKDVYARWVRPGHRSGANTHAISCTINVKKGEWEGIADWMWENRESYNAISVFPHYGGTHKQMPFEDCTEEEYNELSSFLKEIDVTKIIETNDETDLTGELACAGGACEVIYV